MEFIILMGILVVAAIATVTTLAPKIGVAVPLVLVILGVAVSFLPFVPALDIGPELILMCVLPPLLYSASVSMPAMDFRRDFTAISGLSVTLVVVTSVILGFVLSWAIPGIGLATGIALGAIISPTDAVATSIVRRIGVPARVVTVLEGESLLNDATALVLLRSAIAASAVGVSFGGVAFDFARSVIIAVVIGFVVGKVTLLVRGRLSDSVVNTAVSFIIPFIAYLPAEHFDASGLVAVVTAGLVTGNGAARYLSAKDRIAEIQNWHTVELLLEGAVFLLMGLELFGLVSDARSTGGSLWTALAIALLAATIVVVVRIAFVAPLLVWLSKSSARKSQRMSNRLARRRQFSEGDPRFPRRTPGEMPGRPRRTPRENPGRMERMFEAERNAHLQERLAERIERFAKRVRRVSADVDYLASAPLGWREGTVLVWAGMRGVVTLAAAQTLPNDTPQRSMLILVAFTVAAGTLIVQGGSLSWLVKRLGLDGHTSVPAEELSSLHAELSEGAATLLDSPNLVRANGEPFDDEVLERLRLRFATYEKSKESEEPEENSLSNNDAREQFRELHLATIRAYREVLLDIRSEGTYSSAALKKVLNELDAEEISTQLKGQSES